MSSTFQVSCSIVFTLKPFGTGSTIYVQTSRKFICCFSILVLRKMFRRFQILAYLIDISDHVSLTVRSEARVSVSNTHLKRLLVLVLVDFCGTPILSRYDYDCVKLHCTVLF